jgi:hypothetical protein
MIIPLFPLYPDVRDMDNSSLDYSIIRFDHMVELGGRFPKLLERARRFME